MEGEERENRKISKKAAAFNSLSKACVIMKMG